MPINVDFRKIHASICQPSTKKHSSAAKAKSHAGAITFLAPIERKMPLNMEAVALSASSQITRDVAMDANLLQGSPRVT